MANDISANALTAGSQNASTVQMTTHTVKMTLNIFLNEKFEQKNN